MKLPIPIEALEDAGIVLGRRGAGKSNALMCLFEHELDAGHRAVMIDPKGDRWGIRMNHDGSPSRYAIPIFGGDHGDLALTEDMGETLGKLVAGHDLSCLIDLSHLSLNAKQRFMLGFAPALLQHNRAALTLFIEEVDQFANQDPRYQPAMLVHHIANFSTLGRQRGIVPWVASQRPAKVNATVRSQADTFVGMKVTSPLDRDAYRDWFKGHGKDAAARVEEEIGRLSPGEALVWVGATEFFDKVKFPMAATFDSGRTPKHGERIEAFTLAPIDLGSIRKALDLSGADRESTYVNEKQVSGDSVKLQARIAELEAERDEWTIESAVGQQQLDELARQNAALVSELQEMCATLERLTDAAVRARKVIEGVEAGGSEEVEDRPSPTNAARDRYELQIRKDGPQSTLQSDSMARDRAPRHAPPASTLNGSAKLGAERRPLAALAQVYPSGLTEAQWATSAGMKRSGGTWGTYKSRLRSAGLIEQSDGRWFATEAGAAATGPVELPPAPGPDLARWWAGKLESVGRMTEVLIEAWPKWISREELAARLDMSASGGSFGTYLSRLSGPGLIERDRERGVRLSSDVMRRVA